MYTYIKTPASERQVRGTSLNSTSRTGTPSNSTRKGCTHTCRPTANGLSLSCGFPSRCRQHPQSKCIYRYVYVKNYINLSIKMCR